MIKLFLSVVIIGGAFQLGSRIVVLILENLFNPILFKLGLRRGF